MVLLRCCENAKLVCCLPFQAHAGKTKELSYDATVCYVCFVGVKLYYVVAVLVLFSVSDGVLVLDACCFVLLLTCIGWVECFTIIKKNS